MSDKTRDWQIIGQNLSLNRFLMHRTREELAERLGMSTETLYNLEKGREEFTINLVVTLALSLGIQPYELLVGTDVLDINEANKRFVKALESILDFVKNDDPLYPNDPENER